MPDTAQGDLFNGPDAARECLKCGDEFVPEEDYHRYCEECYERSRQRQRPRREEPGGEWMDRLYGGA